MTKANELLGLCEDGTKAEAVIGRFKDILSKYKYKAYYDEEDEDVTILVDKTGKGVSKKLSKLEDALDKAGYDMNITDNTTSVKELDLIGE